MAAICSAKNNQPREGDDLSRDNSCAKVAVLKMAVNGVPAFVAARRLSRFGLASSSLIQFSPSVVVPKKLQVAGRRQLRKSQ
jgi:hypothetical protein